MRKHWLAAIGVLLFASVPSWGGSITIVQNDTTTNSFPLAQAQMRTTGNNALNPGQPQLVWQGTPVPGTSTGPDFPGAAKPWTWTYTFSQPLAFQTVFESPAAGFTKLTSAYLDLNAAFSDIAIELIGIYCSYNSTAPSNLCSASDPRVIDPYTFWVSSTLFGGVKITAGSTSVTYTPQAGYTLPLRNIDLIELGFKEALLAGNDLVIDWQLNVAYHFDLSNYPLDCKNCGTTYQFQPSAKTNSNYVARLYLSDVPEPSTTLLMGAGLGLMGLALARRKKTAKA